MRQQAADVVAGGVGEAGVALLVVEQRLAVLPQGLVGVHAAAAVVETRFGHEGGDLAVLVGGVLHDVLELQVIGHVQGVELVVDLWMPPVLPRGKRSIESHLGEVVRDRPDRMVLS